MMEKCLIAAVADDGALGKDNELLWHLSEDLKYFKRLTSGHPVIMGRKTFESLGRPLPKRLNIVLSRRPAAVPPLPASASADPSSPLPSDTVPPDPSRPLIAAATLDEAFALAGATPFEGRLDEPDRCFIMGGGSIYAQALEQCDKLFLTEVHTTCPSADTYFPTFDKSRWKELSRSETLSEEGLTYEFVVYGR